MNSVFRQRKFLVLIILLLSTNSRLYSQFVRKVSLELLTATSTNSKKHFNYNTNERWYFEGRLGYRITRYLETSVSVAYQERDYIYFAMFPQPYREIPLFMKRNYVPIACNLRLYLSDFFYEKLKVWKASDKWDVYIQLGLFTIKGNDVHDSRESEFASQGAYVPYYKYPYVDVYHSLYISYIAGVRRSFGKTIGVFIEGGEGLLMNGQLGLSIRL